MNKLKTLFFSIIIGLAVAGIVFAWTNPIANPPSGGGALYYYTGNVGIGTTNPGTYGAFEVRRAVTGTYGPVSGSFSDASNNTFSIGHVSGHVKLISDAALSLWTGATPVERVRIDINGNVGIGTVSPGAKLDVAGQIKGDIAQYNCYWSANDFPCDNGYYAASSKSYNPADNNCVVQNYCCKLK